MPGLFAHTARHLRELMKKGDVSPVAVTGEVLDRIESCESRVHAYVALNKAGALEAAKRCDASSSLPLSGVPVAVKDNLCVRNESTTCASRILSGFKPPYDATVITRMRDAGAIHLGKTNMDEFAFGSSCETSFYGPTRNPWDFERIPGGSSGGSAAAVASGEAVMALGSDTGGSIRQPAAMCGVVGLKPTYGRVSRYGLIAFGSSLDQIGPITKDVRDAALLLGVIAGYDEMDTTSVNIPVPDYLQASDRDLKGLRIGIPKEYFVDGIDPEVLAAVKEAIEVLKKSGAIAREISLPHTEYAVSTYYIIGPAEASSNLARFDGVSYGFRASGAKGIIDMYTQTRSQGFGDEAKRRVLLGTYVLSSGYYEAYYLKAQKVRTKIIGDFINAFKEVDCIITPTAPTAAFKIGEKSDDPLAMYLSDIFTIPANLAGVPAMSVPCGFTKSGMPVGMQIMAPHFKEETLFTVGRAFEERTEWHKRRAPL